MEKQQDNSKHDANAKQYGDNYNLGHPLHHHHLLVDGSELSPRSAKNQLERDKLMHLEEAMAVKTEAAQKRLESLERGKGGDGTKLTG
jgi:hypothetical protein